MPRSFGTHLVIFHGEVLPSSFQVSHLHEIARAYCLPNVWVVALILEGSAHKPDAQASADPQKLGSDAICRLEAPSIEEVVIGPLSVLVVALPCMVDVEESKVVPINVCELCLCLVSSLSRLSRSHKQIGGGEGCSDRNDLIRTSDRRRGE